MEPTRDAARELAREGVLEIMAGKDRKFVKSFGGPVHRGQMLDPDKPFGGPIRLRLKVTPQPTTPWGSTSKPE